MSYNLKAKRKSDGEIVEFTVVSNVYTKYKEVMNKEQFNTLYEVIDDIQEERPMTKGEAEIARGLDELFDDTPKKTIQVPICNSCRKPHFGNKDYNNNCGCDSCGDWTMGEIELDVDDTPIEKGWLNTFNLARSMTDREQAYEMFCKRISEVERDAYKRGQEEAYKESAEVVKTSISDMKLGLALFHGVDNTKQSIINALDVLDEDISKAISK